MWWEDLNYIKELSYYEVQKYNLIYKKIQDKNFLKKY
jgi:hypothetical protein